MTAARLQRGLKLLANAVALHYEFAEDQCCSPTTYSPDCEYSQVCHECRQAWPCDTRRVSIGDPAVMPPDADEPTIARGRL